MCFVNVGLVFITLATSLRCVVAHRQRCFTASSLLNKLAFHNAGWLYIHG